MAPGEGWREAKVETLETTSESPLPSLHRDRRFFRSEVGTVDWRGRPVRLLKVTSPVRVDLFDCQLITQ